MRKHILSQYSEKREVIISEEVKKFYDGKTTYETSSVENSDEDRFEVYGTTNETRSIETSDSDQVILNTALTESIENSDSDGLYWSGTKLTFTVENSDDDAFAT